MAARDIRIDRTRVDIGEIVLRPQAIQLGEVVVHGAPPTAVQKADTTEYMADAFKMNRDALTEDLLSKLPGVSVGNGTVTAGGETVQQILIDGKPFFGTDPTIALRNLPAEAVERVQVFDKISNQAEFTGFDDGQSMRTINIITRPRWRNAQFGRFYGGYGETGHYNGGGALNLFDDGRRLSIIGLSNNVNQQNFSVQDILGAIGNGAPQGVSFGGGFIGRTERPGGRGGRQQQSVSFQQGPASQIGNFLVGPQNGLTAASSLGMNYANAWGSTLNISGSYFFNSTNNQNGQVLSRQYFLTGDSTSFYHESNASGTRNLNHRINLRVEHSPGSANSLLAFRR